MAGPVGVLGGVGLWLAVGRSCCRGRGSWPGAGPRCCCRSWRAMTGPGAGGPGPLAVVVVGELSSLGGVICCAWCRWRGRFAAVPGGPAWATAGAARRQCVAADRGSVGGSCCCGSWLRSGFFPMCIARSPGAHGGVPGADAPGGYVLPIGRQEKRTTPYSKNPAKNKKYKITKTY